MSHYPESSSNTRSFEEIIRIWTEGTDEEKETLTDEERMIILSSIRNVSTVINE